MSASTTSNQTLNATGNNGVDAPPLYSNPPPRNPPWDQAAHAPNPTSPNPRPGTNSLLPPSLSLTTSQKVPTTTRQACPLTILRAAAVITRTGGRPGRTDGRVAEEAASLFLTLQAGRAASRQENTIEPDKSRPGQIRRRTMVPLGGAGWRGG